MKNLIISVGYFATVGYFAAGGYAFASSQWDSNQPHASDGVYQIEYQSAQRLHQHTSVLQRSVEQFCQQQSDLETVKRAWRQSMQAWMSLQGQERGPETALEQSWNIQFWPDKKNTTGRKMASAVKTQNWSRESLQQQSVTIQGLGALEWLLFDSQAPLTKNPQASCSLAEAIAGALAERTALVQDAWSTNPWQSLDHNVWQSEYLSLLTNQLDYSLKKLSLPLAKVGHPKPYFAESWRAKSSLSQLKANIEALNQLYLANGQGLDRLLRVQGNRELADLIKQQFVTLLATWPEQASLFDTLQSKQGYTQLLAQYNKLEYLRYLMAEQAAMALGVVIGFNATDGD